MAWMSSRRTWYGEKEWSRMKLVTQRVGFASSALRQDGNCFLRYRCLSVLVCSEKWSGVCTPYRIPSAKGSVDATLWLWRAPKCGHDRTIEKRPSHTQSHPPRCQPSGRASLSTTTCLAISTNAKRTLDACTCGRHPSGRRREPVTYVSGLFVTYLSDCLRGAALSAFQPSAHRQEDPPE